MKGSDHIYVNPRVAIAGIASLAGLVGIGFGLNARKKYAKADKVPFSSVKSVTPDVTSATLQEAAGQADAIVVDAVNATRIGQLLKALSRIDRNQAGANEEITKLKAEIQKLLLSNRGGEKGIHGFIGETSQVHISNIKAFINGDEPLYILLDDNSMTDYLRGMQIIQQKACQAGGHLGLDAIRRHADKYPEFLEEGGIYQIPQDMYAKYNRLRNLPEEVALKLRREDLRLWKYIKNFTKENPNIRIEPMEVTYSDIQVGNIDDTVKKVENDTDRAFENQRKEAHDTHAPSLEEFLKVCGISAAIEGGVSAATELILKLKSGKKLSEFTKEDLKDILGKLVVGSGKEAVRGGIVYALTNIYRIPAAITSGTVTALFAVCHEGYLFFKNRISRKQLIKNSIFSIIESLASVVGATIGKHVFKKCPIIGAIAGSIFGSAAVGYARKTAFA